jgi:hypothetical protein
MYRIINKLLDKGTINTNFESYNIFLLKIEYNNVLVICKNSFYGINLRNGMHSLVRKFFLKTVFKILIRSYSFLQQNPK